MCVRHHRVHGLIASLVLLAACSRQAGTADGPAREVNADPRPRVEVVSVTSGTLTRDLRLPAELAPFEDVQLHARAQGFVESMSVDLGSRVVRGQTVATIVAPELGAQRSEAAARVQSAEAQRLEAAAQLAASTATHERLVAASKTPGIIAGHELELAAQAVAAGRARVQAARQSVAAAGQALSSLEAIESYLRVVSPFDGVVTERRVHPGSLVGPETSPLVRIQQVSSLRLVINVPEIDVGRVDTGHMVTFTVPAFPDRTFQGRVARVARALDPRTRSMTVEADVENAGGQLAPGMFAEVRWTAARVEPSLFVPASAVVTTTERTFVVRVRDGRAEWVDVRRGGSMDGLVEVFGSLQVGDQIAVRGTDEIRADTAVEVVAAG